jgi:4-hydroxy-3-methylbut-2-enyl diphosphate reductase
VFSAHGVAPAVKEHASELGLRQIDATCPLVTKVHHEVRHYVERGYSVLLVGHRGHVEVVGTAGVAPESTWIVESPQDVDAVEVPDPDRVAYVTQTTLSVDEANRVVEAIRARFPNAAGPRGDDICYATQNRQDATKELARSSDLVLVVGSTTSSNSRRMVEVALEQGAPDACLIDGAGDIDPAWLAGVGTVGLTSGASAPDLLVDQVVERLQQSERGAIVERLQVVEEDMQFAPPKELDQLPLMQ